MSKTGDTTAKFHRKPRAEPVNLDPPVSVQAIVDMAQSMFFDVPLTEVSVEICNGKLKLQRFAQMESGT